MTMNLLMHEQYKRLVEVEKELTEIKEGIKRNNMCTIIDGNDMMDHGWMTHQEHNRRMREYKEQLEKEFEDRTRKSRSIL